MKQIKWLCAITVSLSVFAMGCVTVQQPTTMMRLGTTTPFQRSWLVRQVTFHEIATTIEESWRGLDPILKGERAELEKMKGLYQSGDQLWFYSITRPGGGPGYSGTGYALVREDVVIFSMIFVGAYVD